ncbi:MAG TPA: MFS transporter, partial [Thermoanaerobaculia bacterium]
AAAGPTLTALAMQFVGPIGFPLFLAVVHLALGLFSLYRMTRRSTVAAADRGAYMSLPPPSAVFTPLAQESAGSQAPSAASAPVLVDAS